MPSEPQHPSDDPGTAGVRATLQAFQDGYTRRDPEQSHALMQFSYPTTRFPDVRHPGKA